MSKVSSDPFGSDPKDAEVDEAVQTHQSELGLSNKEAEGITALQAGAALAIAAPCAVHCCGHVRLHSMRDPSLIGRVRDERLVTPLAIATQSP